MAQNIGKLLIGKQNAHFLSFKNLLMYPNSMPNFYFDWGPAEQTNNYPLLPS